MKDIAELVRHLRTVSETASPEGVLRELWSKVEGRLDREYDGNIQAVTQFVMLMRKILKEEQQTQSRESMQGVALGMLILQLLRPPFLQAFTQIKREKFTFQLAVRVVFPESIHQAEANLCGTVAMVVQMAHTKPVDYVDLAISLFKGGRAVLHDVEVKPNRVLIMARSVRDLSECDYVVLTSVRNSAASVRTTSLGLGGLGTAECCDWLRRAGYVDIENHAFDSPELERFYPEGATPERILRKVAQKRAQGFNVLMMEDAEIAFALTRGIPVRDRQNRFRHLTYVVEFLLDAHYVRRIKAAVWGGCYERVDIEISVFLEHFKGALVYRDRY